MESLARKPVAQQAADSIREYIMSDSVQVGDKLPTEREFCERLNVGRSTLREATRMLQASGYIENRPGRGSFVASKDGQSMGDAIRWLSTNKVELQDFVEVRMAIEGLAVRLAIPRATKQDLEALTRIHNAFIEAAMDNDSDTVSKLDDKFHNYIVKMTKNQLLISINKTVSGYFKNFRSQTFKIPRNLRNSIAPHTAIYDAFIQKDVRRGEAEMLRHLEKVMEDLENEPLEGAEQAAGK